MPPVITATLSFIEDRHLFDPGSAERNPAIEWKRLGLAVAGRIGGVVAPQLRQGGGSTLATQIEKFRHSPRGLTSGVGEKMRQMLTASARAYMSGRNTSRRRQEIITTYLNATPLAAMPGYGEVIGVPEALWVWLGTDYEEATKILNTGRGTLPSWRAKGSSIARCSVCSSPGVGRAITLCRIERRWIS